MRNEMYTLYVDVDGNSLAYREIICFKKIILKLSKQWNLMDNLCVMHAERHEELIFMAQ